MLVLSDCRPIKLCSFFIWTIWLVSVSQLRVCFLISLWVISMWRSYQFGLHEEVAFCIVHWWSQNRQLSWQSLLIWTQRGSQTTIYLHSTDTGLQMKRYNEIHGNLLFVEKSSLHKGLLARCCSADRGRWPRSGRVRPECSTRPPRPS